VQVEKNLFAAIDKFGQATRRLESVYEVDRTTSVPGKPSLVSFVNLGDAKAALKKIGQLKKRVYILKCSAYGDRKMNASGNRVMSTKLYTDSIVLRSANPVTSATATQKLDGSLSATSAPFVVPVWKLVTSNKVPGASKVKLATNTANDDNFYGYDRHAKKGTSIADFAVNGGDGPEKYHLKNRKSQSSSFPLW
jgi:hypothetical protein